MPDMINVVVKLFGPAADAVGHDTLEYGLTPQAMLGSLIALLYAKYPRLAAGAGSMRFAINGEYTDLNAVLADGDEIAIIPPVAGG